MFSHITAFKGRVLLKGISCFGNVHHTANICKGQDFKLATKNGLYFFGFVFIVSGKDQFLYHIPSCFRLPHNTFLPFWSSSSLRSSAEKISFTSPSVTMVFSGWLPKPRCCGETPNAK